MSPALGAAPTSLPPSDGSRRTLAMSAPAKVIPLKPYQKNRLTPTTAPRIPEPANLYCLIVLAFVLHVPYRNADVCVQCHTAWPCEQIRLAYRLREAF